MIQVAPQMRILVAIESVDLRKYAPFIVMWSRGEGGLEKLRRTSLGQRGKLHIT